MNKWFIISSVLIWIACNPKPIPIELEPHQPKLVVSSQVVPNQIMLIALTKSFNVLEHNESEDSLNQVILEDLLVENAEVVISYRDVVDTLFMVQPGLYASITTPQYTNEVYSLSCNDNQGLTCTANSLMLEKVNFDEVTLGEVVDSTLTINYAFTDIAGANYYMVNVYKKGQNTGALDNNSIFENGSNVLLKTELITDIAYESNAISSSFDVYGLTPTDTVAVSLSNIDKTYYEYLQLRQKSGNWFSEITQEPINYPTNVENGYGFFNTHFPDVRIFYLAN